MFLRQWPSNFFLDYEQMETFVSICCSVTYCGIFINLIWRTCMRGGAFDKDKSLTVLSAVFRSVLSWERQWLRGNHHEIFTLQVPIHHQAFILTKNQLVLFFYRALYTGSLACLALLLYRIFKAPNQPCDLPPKHLERLALLVKEVLHFFVLCSWALFQRCTLFWRVSGWPMHSAWSPFLGRLGWADNFLGNVVLLFVSRKKKC